jgi:predicted alpha/beta superfamily hydrolase
MYPTYQKNNHYTRKKRFFKKPLGGKGELYLSFIVNSLIPYIEANYRVKSGAEGRAIVGSSMGGLISLYAGLIYPEYFKKIGALSNAIWFNEKEMLRDLKTGLAFENDQKIYMDVGTQEIMRKHKQYKKGLCHRYVSANDDVAALVSQMVSKENFMYRKVKHAKHDECAWEKRFLSVLEFLFDMNRVREE